MAFGMHLDRRPDRRASEGRRRRVEESTAKPDAGYMHVRVRRHRPADVVDGVGRAFVRDAAAPTSTELAGQNERFRTSIVKRACFCFCFSCCRCGVGCGCGCGEVGVRRRRHLRHHLRGAKRYFCSLSHTYTHTHTPTHTGRHRHGRSDGRTVGSNFGVRSRAKCARVRGMRIALNLVLHRHTHTHTRFHLHTVPKCCCCCSRTPHLVRNARTPNK